MKTGYCACGCGQKTKISKRTLRSRGAKKGEPNRYLHGHSNNQMKGEKHPHWNGGISKNVYGYVLVLQPDHPRANCRGYIFEHILIAEKLLGECLPDKAEIHHVNGIKGDNRPENLVICQDRAYHQLIHQRQRALEACGHADWLKCPYCKHYDDPVNMFVLPNGHAYHRKCQNRYARDRYKRITQALKQTQAICQTNSGP